MTELHRWRHSLVPLWLGAVLLLAGGLESLAVDPNDCYAVADSNDVLVTINRTTGANAIIGSTGASNIEAIAFGPGGNVLYAADAGRLGTLSLTTGDFTPTSSSFGTGDGPEGSVPFSEVDALSFDPLTGILFGSVNRSGSDVLIRINTSTGSHIPNAFGPGVDYAVIDGPGFHDTIDALAVDPTDGQMYGINNSGSSSDDQLVKINKATGAGTVVGDAGPNDMGGLGFTNGGTLYGSTGSSSSPNSNENKLWTINKATGAASPAHSFSSYSDYEAVDCLTAGQNTISGTVFEDNNSNGLFDSGDVGRSGVTVLLYADNNANGLVEPTDTLLDSQDSDGSGQYLFTVSTPGNFVMQIEVADLPSGSVMTTDNVEVASFTGSGQSDTGNNFGAAVNDPPAAVNDAASTGRGYAVTVPVLDNDSDPEGQSLTVTAVTLPSNGTALINADNTITYTLAAGFTGNDSFNYTVTDSQGATATAGVSVSVIWRADLAMSKLDDPDPVTAGNQLTYTLTATNNGPSDAENVLMEDTIPDGTTFVSISPSAGCTTNGPDLSCTVGSMPPGASITWSITVLEDKVGAEIEDGSTLENIARIESDTPDANVNNNQAIQETDVLAPKLALSKTAAPSDGSRVSPGEELSFTINYSNSGSVPATNVVLTDDVHSSLGDVNPSTGGSFDPETRRITWNLGTLEPGSAGSVSFAARVGASPSRQTITNEGCATASELLSAMCSNSTNHRLRVPDVLVLKSADRAENSELRAFDVVTYRLTIRAEGEGRAVGVLVTDTPPPHMSYVPGTRRVDGAQVQDSGGTSPLFAGGLPLETIEEDESRSVTYQMSVDVGAPARALMQNWAYVQWDEGTLSVGDFYDLRVLRPRAGPRVRQTILVEGPAGRIIFVTVFKQVLNILPVTGYPSVVLALLALSSLGVGTTLSSSISPSLFRTRSDRPEGE